MRFVLSLCSLALMIVPSIAADLQRSGGIGSPPKPRKFNLSAVEVTFPLTERSNPPGFTGSGRPPPGTTLIKEYNSNSPLLDQIVNNRDILRYELYKKLYMKSARRYRNWQFSATRTYDSSGNDTSKVFFSYTQTAFWWTQDGGKGLLVTFKNNGQAIYSVELGYIGSGVGPCWKTIPKVIPPFYIDNAVFGLTTEITVQARADGMDPCGEKVPPAP